jgi:hypothetical protein
MGECPVGALAVTLPLDPPQKKKPLWCGAAKFKVRIGDNERGAGGWGLSRSRAARTLGDRKIASI